jgi:hypothetical protein
MPTGPMASGKTIECRLDGWDVQNGVLETWWQLIGLAEAGTTRTTVDGSWKGHLVVTYAMNRLCFGLQHY